MFNVYKELLMTWQNDSDPMIGGKKKVIERYNRMPIMKKKCIKKDREDICQNVRVSGEILGV